MAGDQSFLLLLLLLTATIVTGQFIPAGQVEVCLQVNSTQTCRNKFFIIGYVTDTSSNWAVQFVLAENTTYRDQYQNVWRLDKPVFLSVQAQDQRIEYGLTPLTVNKNAYQTLSNYFEIGFCPANAYCCTGQSGRWVFSYNQNSTQYHTFTIRPPRFKFNVVITATQDTVTRQLTLNDTTPSASLPAVDASLLLTVPSSLLPDYGLYYNLISTPETAFTEGFLVPKSAFSTEVNKIGVTYQSYYQRLGSENPNCGPISDSYYFAVNGGPAYDQFGTFRGEKIGGGLQNCLYSASKSSLSYGIGARESFLCQGAGVSQVLIELDAAQYQLVKLFGVPVITSKGLFPFTYGSDYAEFFVDVSNRATTNAAFTYTNTKCCFVSNGALECNQNVPFDTKVTAIDALDTARTIMRSPAMYFISAAGLCEFTLSQHGQQALTFNITFDTSSWFQNGQPVGTTCDPPYTTVTVDGIEYCQSPCSIDQVWNSSLAACAPVNCLQKYLGAKSWYNPQTGRCEPSVVCNEGLYDPVNNVCITGEIPTAPFGLDPNTTFPPSDAPTVALNCGPHGVSVGDVCQCADGWTTPQVGPGITREDIPWCSEFAQTRIVNQQGEDEINPLTVILVCGLVFLFLVCCISCCVCCIKKCCCCCKCCLKLRNKLKRSKLGNKMRKIKLKKKNKTKTGQESGV